MLRQTQTRIDEAAADDRILNAPVTLVMKAFGLSYPNAQFAVKRAEDRCRKAKTLTAVEQRAAQDALVVTVRTAEENYPGIATAAVQSVNHAALGIKHQLTRERVRQIAEAVRSLARCLGKTENAVAALAAKGRLPATHRDELESTISAS